MSDDFDDLFGKDDGDPLDDPAEPVEVKKSTEYRADPNEPYVRVTLAWLQRVLPLVESKEQLVVAEWLFRRRAVCKQEWFSVPSGELELELGISRATRYRTLIHLERGGVIAITRLGRQALLVKLLPLPPRQAKVPCSH
jgi:hypothetical protein